MLYIYSIAPVTPNAALSARLALPLRLAICCCFVVALTKAGVGVMAPIAALEANPLPNAVAVVSLEDATKSGGQVTLPAGAIRFAVSIKVSLYY